MKKKEFNWDAFLFVVTTLVVVTATKITVKEFYELKKIWLEVLVYYLAFASWGFLAVYSFKKFKFSTFF